MNKVILCGRVGKDPEVRQAGGGDPVATFSVATAEKWTDRNGQRQEHVEWHQCVAWKRMAEVIGQYITKGSQVLIEGKLNTRSWNDQRTGEKKYRTEIVVKNLEMLGGGTGQRGQQQHSQSHHYQAQHGGEGEVDQQGQGASAELDDEIPF